MNASIAEVSISSLPAQGWHCQICVPSEYGVVIQTAAFACLLLDSPRKQA